MEKEVTIPEWMIFDAIDSAWPNKKFLKNNYASLKEKLNNFAQK